MVFRKSFPKSNDRYPIWEEIVLNDKEELQVEEKARQKNTQLMIECIEDAKKIIDSGISDSKIVKIAIALFEKRSSHSVYWKERACREKFDSLYIKEV